MALRTPELPKKVAPVNFSVPGGFNQRVIRFFVKG